MNDLIVARQGNLGRITLNRPKALNALSSPLIVDLGQALGGALPTFGHHNLLTTASGEGLSKRLGHLSLRGLREAGVDELLDALEARAIPWGVVSNKAANLVALVLGILGYAKRAASVVGGDTLPQRKPDPEPVLHACALAAVAPYLPATAATHA